MQGIYNYVSETNYVLRVSVLQLSFSYNLYYM